MNLPKDLVHSILKQFVKCITEGLERSSFFEMSLIVSFKNIVTPSMELLY